MVDSDFNWFVEKRTNRAENALLYIKYLFYRVLCWHRGSLTCSGAATSPLSPLSEWCSCSVPACRGETDGPEEPIGSSNSVPDVCQGDVQSGISGGGACEGLSLSVSSWSRSTSDRGAAAGGWALPGTCVTAAAVSAGALSDVTSSKGSKMRGRASDDMVPSVASSWDSGTTVSTVINTSTETGRGSGHEASNLKGLVKDKYGSLKMKTFLLGSIMRTKLGRMNDKDKYSSNCSQHIECSLWHAVFSLVALALSQSRVYSSGTMKEKKKLALLISRHFF